MPSSPYLFISDLHLDGSHPEITEQFLRFLRDEARRAQALYILGDLFEAWIGDDDPDSDKLRVQKALRDFTDSGIPCYLIHGNRDFLIGRRFCEATGVRLLRDGTVATIGERAVLLMHGDTLCTDDPSYQRLRRIVRNPIVQFVFRTLSLRKRQALAAKMRAGSKAHIQNSMAAIMDVNASAVVAAFEKYGVDTMIHGHTHRPATHVVDVHGKAATRIVLGDWYAQGSVLRWDESGYRLSALPR